MSPAITAGIWFLPRHLLPMKPEAAQPVPAENGEEGEG